MHTVITLAEVRAIYTRRGSVRYVSKDTDGNEYTTLREDIGERARQLQGRRVRLEYHQEQRGQYTNVYLDKIDPVEPAAAPGPDTDPQQAAWQTAVTAAPWLVGEPSATVPPEKLYESGSRSKRALPPILKPRGGAGRHGPSWCWAPGECWAPPG